MCGRDYQLTYSFCSIHDGQGAYNLIMEATDVRIQYKLREGCGKLKPQQCLADGASTSFQGTACTATLRTAICTGDTSRFRTCAGQGQCACPAAGDPGYAKGAVWGLSSGCSSVGCKAGCAADGQSFTGGALTTKQLADLASGASDGEAKLVQAMGKLLAHIGGTGVMSNTNLATQSSRVEEFAALLKRTPALVKKAFDLVDAYESSSDGMLIYVYVDICLFIKNIKYVDRLIDPAQYHLIGW